MNAGTVFGFAVTVIIIMSVWWWVTSRYKNAQLAALREAKEKEAEKADDFQQALEAFGWAANGLIDPSTALKKLDKYTKEPVVAFLGDELHRIYRACELVFLVHAIPQALAKIKKECAAGAVDEAVTQAWNMSATLGHHLNAIPVLTGMQEGEFWEQLQEYRRQGHIAQVKRFLDADLSNVGLALQQVERAINYMGEHEVSRDSLTDDERALLGAADDVAVNTETFRSRLRVVKTVATEAEPAADAK